MAKRIITKIGDIFCAPFVRADMLSDRFEYRETKFAVRRGQQM